LHHGWLISGPAGIGKATLAFRFARWLLAGGSSADLSVDERLPSFHRIAAGSHADVFTVARRVNVKTDKLQSEIVINTIQEASKFMRLTPAEGGWRVVVIDGAEDMNPNAANALLKLLEEPPQRAILLLVTAAPGRLLPTIRSRCRSLALSPLADEEISALLADYAPELGPAARERLVGISEGSIGTALGMADEGGLVVAGLVEEVLAGKVAAGRAQNIAETVTRAVEGVDKFVMFMDLLRSGLAAATRKAARAGGAQLAGQVGLWQEIGRIEREVVNLNMDKRAAVIVTLNALYGL
jgi:DNA polymerase-3 subunit delta'